MVFAKDYESESYLISGYQAGKNGVCCQYMSQPYLLRTDRPSIQLGISRHSRRLEKPRILLYSHDTFGLGNIKRTLLLAENYLREYPGASILIITGSPVIHALRLPTGIDYIKLPSLDRIDAEQYAPLFLSDCGEEISKTRREIIERVAIGFRPDLFVVDKRAAGINSELLGALEALRESDSRVKMVLGIRDILDEPGTTSRVLRENGSFETIEKYYDEVWIYGIKEIFDTAALYSFPENIRSKTRYCGYLKRPVAPPPERDGVFRVLVTTGGGGDGSSMIRSFLEGLAIARPEFPLRSTVIFGPHMSATERAGLVTEFGDLKDTAFLDFEPDLASHYAEADLVFSMAGYNTVCELLSHRKKAVLVPRTTPVREQLIRARILDELGIFRMIEPQNLSGKLMMRMISEESSGRPDIKRIPGLDGLPRITYRTKVLLEDSDG